MCFLAAHLGARGASGTAAMEVLRVIELLWSSGFFFLSQMYQINS